MRWRLEAAGGGLGCLGGEAAGFAGGGGLGCLVARLLMCWWRFRLLVAEEEAAGGGT